MKTTSQPIVSFMVFVGFIFVSNASAQTVAFKESRPNIIWVMGEDLSPELGCYNHPAVKTPNFDRLADEGVRYTQAFCTAPSCTPSRNAMMTGVYQTRTDTQDQRRGGIVLPENIRPMTQWLREAGYYTALGCGFSDKTDLNFEPAAPLFDGKDWDQRGAGQPFFAQITLYDSHRLEDGWDKIHQLAPNQVDPQAVELPPYFPDTLAIRNDWARYLESIQSIDTKFGLILKRLENEGIADNTLVIFSGDNGRCHLRGKCWLYEGGIHVPLLIRWPGHTTLGTVNDEMISMIDVTATILDVAGVKLPAVLDGHPIMGPRKKTREHVFAARDLIDEVMDHIRCVRTKQFKYIRNYTPQNGYRECKYVQNHRPMLAEILSLQEAGKLNAAQQLLLQPTKPVEELYDLVNDPHELHNLAASADQRATLERLRGLLDGWIADTGDQGLRN